MSRRGRFYPVSRDGWVAFYPVSGGSRPARGRGRVRLKGTLAKLAGTCKTACPMNIKDEILGTLLIYAIAGLIMLGLTAIFWEAYH